MRALITCVPGFGHLLPMLPMARALADSGQDVAMPASLQTDAASPHADVIRALRPLAPPLFDGEHLPTWMSNRRRAPPVYMTLGTWTNSDVSMFRYVVDGLAEADLEVLLTVGPGNDPGAIGPLPANAHVEQYVAQSLLLPQCAVVICHGGAGTTLGALAHGLPLLALPQGADQYVISERLVSSGAGLCLLPAEVSPTTVRSTVVQLLDGVEHRAPARPIQQEIVAMPGPEQTVALIDQLVVLPQVGRLSTAQPLSTPPVTRPMTTPAFQPSL